jgi:hypothetical protein
MGHFVYRTNHKYPDYKLKHEFSVGTFGENDWKLGEIACVDRYYYRLPNDSEYAIFKFAERTRTGGKKLRWEVYHNGKFSNNYFTCLDDATECIENEISFFGFKGNRSKYRIESEWEE